MADRRRHIQALEWRSFSVISKYHYQCSRLGVVVRKKMKTRKKLVSPKVQETEKQQLKRCWLPFNFPPNLIAHLHLVPILRMSGTIPPLCT